MKEVTPFEEAVLRANDFAAGLALSGIVMNLIQEGEDHKAVMHDRTRTLAERKVALKEARKINDTLSVVALTQSVMGIGA